MPVETTQSAPGIDPETLQDLITKFPADQSSLIPLLQQVQEQCGYIPREAVDTVANALGLFPSQVFGVITFYSQFYTEPRGRNVVRVCRGTACHVRGGKKILQLVQNELGVQDGETTPDYQFSLETVACLGACALSPVMVVNHSYYGKMNPKKIATILNQYASR
jgi:NADH-quinone oxidoreductase E subunit